MKIGELAKQSGLAAHTIRFYEAEGLLSKVPRSDNGYRQYGEEELNTLIRIQLGQKLGLSLQDMKAMGKHDEILDKDKISQQLDKKLDEIQQLRQTLDTQEQNILLIKEDINNGVHNCGDANKLVELLK